MVAIERLISCGGAAGSLDTEVLLAPAGGEADSAEVVVATTGPVYSVRWRDAETLVVEVSPVDEVGDPVSEYVERWEDVQVVLERRGAANNEQ